VLAAWGRHDGATGLTISKHSARATRPLSNYDMRHKNASTGVAFDAAAGDTVATLLARVAPRRLAA
jgi:hypothetical protein